MATKRSRGRQTRLTNELRERILESLRQGHRFAVACRAANINSRMGDEWLRRGRGEDKRAAIPVYVSFAKDVEAAIDETETKAIETIRKAIEGGEKKTRIHKTMIPRPDGNSPTGYRYIVTEEKTSEETLFSDWKAAAWWLERCRPESYAPPQKHEITGKEGAPVAVIIMPSAEE